MQYMQYMIKVIVITTADGLQVLGELGPGQLGPGLLGPGAQLSTFSGWTIGPRSVGPWGRNPPTNIYPPIVGRIYPILVYKFN